MRSTTKGTAALRDELERLFTKIIERGKIDQDLLREIVALPYRDFNEEPEQKEERGQS